MKLKPRNPMGIHVHKRKAGAHIKTFKAARRKENVETRKLTPYDEIGYHT